MGSDAAGGPQQGPSLKGTPAPEEADANQGELQFSEAFSFHATYKRLTSCALCSPSDSPEPSAARAKAEPASRAATAESGGAARDDVESDGATADEERDTTPRNQAVHYGGMAGPSKPRAQKRKRANGGGKGGGAKVGADKKGRLLEDGDEPDNVVPDSRPASEAADDASADEDEDPAPKKGRRLDKGKGRAVSPRPTPTKDTSAASTATFDFPMVKMSTKGVFIPENEDGRVDLSELPTCFEVPSLRCSLALITSLTASQSRALAQDRKTLGLPSFKNEDALLEQMDKRSLKRTRPRPALTRRGSEYASPKRSRLAACRRRVPAAIHQALPSCDSRVRNADPDDGAKAGSVPSAGPLTQRRERQQGGHGGIAGGTSESEEQGRERTAGGTGASRVERHEGQRSGSTGARGDLQHHLYDCDSSPGGAPVDLFLIPSAPNAFQGSNPCPAGESFPSLTFRHGRVYGS